MKFNIGGRPVIGRTLVRAIKMIKGHPAGWMEAEHISTKQSRKMSRISWKIKTCRKMVKSRQIIAFLNRDKCWVDYLLIAKDLTFNNFEHKRPNSSEGGAPWTDHGKKHCKNYKRCPPTLFIEGSLYCSELSEMSPIYIVDCRGRRPAARIRLGVFGQKQGLVKISLRYGRTSKSVPSSSPLDVWFLLFLFQFFSYFHTWKWGADYDRLFSAF